MDRAALLRRAHDLAAHTLFPPAAIVGLGLLTLGGAYAFQYWGGLPPCPLCLEQRVPWAVLIVLGVAIAGIKTLRPPGVVTLALYAGAIGVALWSAGLGLYHAGIEYTWWEGPQSCTGVSPLDGNVTGSLDDAAVIRCDEVPWALFGVSLAGFNFLFSLAAAAVAGFGAWTAWKEMR